MLRTWHGYFRHNVAAFGPQMRSIDDLTIDAISDKLIWGSPRECAEQIQRRQDEAQMDTLALVLRQAIGQPITVCLAGHCTLGEGVFPRLA